MSVKSISPRRIAIAPMIDCTDRHFRYLMRLISRKCYLYTEMITADALLNGDHKRLLAFSKEETPVALQLGGCSPEKLALASKIGEDFGYSEINLNVGCPSTRVQAGRFGAVLMKEPTLVRDCITAMVKSVNIPVTVKCRIGVDKEEGYEAFYDFINTVKEAPCNTFIVHARKAWLKGLSPKENRTIPPLKYEFVTRLKKDFPELEIIINGGIKDLDEVGAFKHLDGMMIGREAYHNPYHLIDVDKDFYQTNQTRMTRREILKAFEPYMVSRLEEGVKFSYIARHLSGLSHGIKGGARWRQYLNEKSNKTIHDYQKVLGAFPVSLS